MISRIVGFITRKPVIYTIHGWGFGSGRRRLVSFLVYWVEVLLKRLTFLYIAVSEHDRQVGLGAVGIRDEKIITIHNGIKSNNCIPKQENVEWDCIMVARDDPQKDYDTLLKAAALASFKLAVVGKGTDSPEFLMRARVFSGSGFNNISFLGIRGDVQSLLCKSHLFILSSNFEGLPLSVIEGMACGLPVIASDVGGLSELVAQENGVLFKSGDHIKLASIISDYLNNPEIIQLHGRASRIKFEKYFSREIMLNKTFEVYSSVVK
jgi:glycosyltransferase involved in cell wall biosynthesis